MNSRTRHASDPPGPNPFAELSDRLERFARTRENPETRREVERALRSKWEGARANAAKVLGIWGGRRSVDALREALESSLEKPVGWAFRSVLVKALCACADPADDAPWMLECYFAASFDSQKRAAQWGGLAFRADGSEAAAARTDRTRAALPAHEPRGSRRTRSGVAGELRLNGT